jgi:hypothetical protein
MNQLHALSITAEADGDTRLAERFATAAAELGDALKDG